MLKSTKCLLVEDDDILGEVFGDCLEECGFEVRRVNTCAEAMHELRFIKFDLILLDYILPDMNSLGVADYAAMTCPNSRIILLTGSGVFPNGEHKSQAPSIDWILRKPVPLTDLRAIAEYARADAERQVHLNASPQYHVALP